MEKNIVFEFAHANQLDNYLVQNCSNYFDFNIIGQQVMIEFFDDNEIKKLKKVRPKNKTNRIWIDLIGIDSKYFYLIETKTNNINNSDIDLMKLCLSRFKTYKKSKGLFIIPNISKKKRKSDK